MRLSDEQRDIRREEREAKADGEVTRQERRSIYRSKTRRADTSIARSTTGATAIKESTVLECLSNTKAKPACSQMARA